MKDSLGKSFQVGNNDSSVILKPLFDDKDINDKRVKCNDISGDSSVPVLHCNEVIEKLSALQDNDITSFDDIFFKELKIKEEHYTEKDRYISDRSYTEIKIRLNPCMLYCQYHSHSDGHLRYQWYLPVP